MDTLFFAKVIGLYALIEGISMLVARSVLLQAFREIGERRTVSYVLGVVMVFVGLTIVTLHSIFTDPLTTVISLAGWVVLVEGTIFLWLPNKTIAAYFRPLQQPAMYNTIAAGYLALGAYLVINAL